MYNIVLNSGFHITSGVKDFVCGIADLYLVLTTVLAIKVSCHCPSHQPSKGRDYDIFIESGILVADIATYFM